MEDYSLGYGGLGEAERSGLDGFFYVPDEGAEAQEGPVLVERAQALKQTFYLLVFHYREDGLGQPRPRMAAIVGLARLAAATLNVAECRETTAIQPRQYIYDGFMVSLVIRYKYTFHSDWCWIIC